MNDIPFDRTVDTAYGEAVSLSPLVRRIRARNPGPFTFTGTGTFLIGRGDVAVIDPGPAIDAHVDAILAATKGERISHILVTHTHVDHSPAAKVLQEATGAPTLGFGPHGSGNDQPVEEGGDMAFVPDHEIGDDTVVAGDGWSLRALHTPGHTSNHLCFELAEERALFSGDHVMGWSTSVISPPDGDMADYLASLRRLLDREDVVFYPAHGAPIERPRALVRGFIAHRRLRETQILNLVREGIEDVGGMVRRMYADIDSRLHGAAARSVLAHLIHLVDSGRLTAANGTPSLKARFTLPDRPPG